MINVPNLTSTIKALCGQLRIFLFFNHSTGQYILTFHLIISGLLKFIDK